MRIAQTISEVGLEQGVIAVWPEPRAGQSLKPKFGSRPFPRKPLYALLILIALFCLGAWKSGAPLLSPGLIAVALIVVTVAWPLAILFDRITKRNVWVYPDRILITHARDRVVLRKPELKQAYVYRVGNPPLLAFELLSISGKSHVVALPEEIELTKLVANLRKTGYQIDSDV